MLLAKISPLAKRIVQTSPFETKEFSAEYMVAKCSKLVIGAIPNSFNDQTEFNIKFGNIKYEKKPDGTNGKPMLDVVLTTKVMFTQSELSTWGTDDTIVYDLIAQKLGFTIVETTTMDILKNYQLSNIEL